jgi:hypothetical protein
LGVPLVPDKRNFPVENTMLLFYDQFLHTAEEQSNKRWDKKPPTPASRKETITVTKLK